MASTGTFTVVFTDGVASTELMARLGDERFDEVQRAHLDALRGPVAEFAGREVKSMGDGLMVVFGSAANALDCAVAMHRVIDAGMRAGDEGIELRVGAALGDVTVGDDGDCHGTAVVEAARLCAAAGPGQALVTETVRAVAGSRGSHVFTPFGPLELKGLPEPVEVVEVGWSPIDLDDRSPSIPLPPPLASHDMWELAGRSRELEQLAGWRKEAAGGSTTTVLLGGEPGVGKSRLAREMAVAAHAAGATVLFGRCEEGLQAAFQPFVEALTHHLMHADADTRSGLLTLWSGALTRLVPQFADPDQQRNEQVEQWMLFEALVDWLASTATDRPLVLVLDDLHWADGATLLALLHLVRADRLSGVLIVGTYRDTEVGRTHPLGEVLADLRREARVERLAVRGLDAEGVAEFMERSGGHALDDSARAWTASVRDQTQGNPFFLGELLRHLVETGALVQEEGRWAAVVDPDQLAVPEGVREVVGRRISRLRPRTGDLLTVAAVMGAEFEAGIVAQVDEVDLGDAIDSFDEAIAAGLVAETGAPGRLVFAHALVRHTLTLELSALRRVNLHLAIGRAIESRVGDDPGPRAAELAHHFREAAPRGTDERRKAGYYTRVMAEQAIERLAYAEAADRLDQADELTPDESMADHITRDEILALSSLCGWQTYDLARVGVACRARIRAARAHDDDLPMVDALFPLIASLIARPPEAADVEALDTVVAVDLESMDVTDRRLLDFSGRWGRANVSELDSIRLGAISFAVVYGIQLGPAARDFALAADADLLIERWRRGAAQSTNPSHMAWLGMVAAWSLFARAGASLQLDIATATVEELERQRLRMFVGGPELPVAFGLSRSGRLDELVEHSRTMARAATRSHDMVGLAFAEIMLAVEALVRGRLVDVQPHIDALLTAAPDEPSAQLGALLLTTQLRTAEDRLDEAREMCDLTVALTAGIADYSWLRGAVAAAQGDLVTCESIMRAWHDEEYVVADDLMRSAKLWNMVEAAHACSDGDAASTLYRLLEPYDGELLLVVFNALPASAAFALGRCAETMGDTARARSHYQSAVAFEERIGAVPLADRSRAALALLDED